MGVAALAPINASANRGGRVWTAPHQCVRRLPAAPTKSAWPLTLAPASRVTLAPIATERCACSTAATTGCAVLPTPVLVPRAGSTRIAPRLCAPTPARTEETALGPPNVTAPLSGRDRTVAHQSASRTATMASASPPTPAPAHLSTQALNATSQCVLRATLRPIQNSRIVLCSIRPYSLPTFTKTATCRVGATQQMSLSAIRPSW
mmetsp:Transcript_5587/g.9432  ORF Transcript_5587/g.9432 Transcript_5587/m.9432 type:complete len:205 (-) Transcript_5587:3455-4069(-)